MNINRDSVDNEISVTASMICNYAHFRRCSSRVLFILAGTTGLEPATFRSTI